MNTGTEKRTTTTTTTSSSSSSSSSIARARTHAREAEINVAVEGIRELYQSAIGQPMTEVCERSLRRDLERGTPYIYYHYALVETAYAPRPSWRYTLAIVRRLIATEADEESLMMTLKWREDLL